MSNTTETAEAAYAHNKKTVFDALAEAGIHTVEVSFDGCGDEGQIEGMEALDASNNKIALADSRKMVMFDIELSIKFSDDRHLVKRYSVQQIETTLRDAIERLVYACLEEKCGGWEINEGAYGAFVFAVPDRTITLEYNQRFSDVETTEYSF